MKNKTLNTLLFCFCIAVASATCYYMVNPIEITTIEKPQQEAFGTDSDIVNYINAFNSLESEYKIDSITPRYTFYSNRKKNIVQKYEPIHEPRIFPGQTHQSND